MKKNQGSSRFRVFFTGLCAIALVVSFTAPAHAQSTPTPDATQEKIDAAVARLIAEAEQVDQFDNPKAKITSSRRHPVVRELGPEAGQAVLRRMVQPLTGNIYRDTYIRWHLMPPVQAMLDEHFEQFVKTGKQGLPSQVSKNLVELLQMTRGDVGLERKPQRPWTGTTDDPQRNKDLAILAEKLAKESKVRVGIPPFTREAEGREAIEAAPPERKEAVRQAAERLEQLKRANLVVERPNPSVKRYNDWTKEINRIVREYRLGLAAALLQTGDPAALPKVIDEINPQLAERELIAFDLMSILYDATFAGHLALYDTRTLESARRQLEQVARGADAYRVYKHRNDEPKPDWFHPKERNFADLAYTFIEMMDNPGVAENFLPSATELPIPRPAAPKGRFTAENFDLDDVQSAIDRAIAETLDPNGNGRRKKPSPARDHTGYLMGNAGNDQHYRLGRQALTNWAMLSAGHSFQDPRLFRRIYRSLESDEPFVYSRAMRLQMLARLSPQRWWPWIRRDAAWMGAAVTEKGGFGAYHAGQRLKGWGDHANGQYGVLGLWAAQQAEQDVPLAIWKAIDAHWRQTQQQTPGLRPAGWALGMFNVDDVEAGSRQANLGEVNAPMTAGGVSALTLTERYLGADADTTRVERSRELTKGIAWLDQNFTLQNFGSIQSAVDPYFYLWTIQRVGQATGIRRFNGIDWFREGTATLLNRQNRDDGLWNASNQSTQVSTGFAMLFLSEAMRPIAIAKVQYDGNWNNRPNDLWNFVDYASSTYEVESTWQIFELDQPIDQLMESPILYMSGDAGFDLSDKHIDRLREYIDAGGLLLINPDKADAAMAKSVNQLVEKLYPDRELETLEANHPLYGLHSEVRASVQMRAVTNGVRPLVITFVRDIGQGLQSNDVGRSESFVALSNLYLYTVGMNPRRQRLVSNYLPKTTGGTPPSEIEVARIKHSGDFDPEPGALTQLDRLLTKEHNVKMNLRAVEPGQLGDAKVAFLTTTGDGTLTDAQAKAIRDWIDDGGTLWMDAAGGSQQAVDALAAMLAKIDPQARPTPLASDDPIIDGRELKHLGYDNRRVKYRLYALRNTGVTTSPRLTAIYRDERPAIIYSPDDLTAGLAGLDHWGIFGYDTNSARRLAANGVLSAMGK